MIHLSVAVTLHFVAENSMSFNNFVTALPVASYKNLDALV